MSCWSQLSLWLRTNSFATHYLVHNIEHLPFFTAVRIYSFPRGFKEKTSVSTVTRLANIDHNILCLNNFSCLKCILIHLYKLPRFSSSKHSGFITSLFKMFIMITFLLQEICYIIVGLSLFSDVSYNKLLSSSGSILLLSPWQSVSLSVNLPSVKMLNFLLSCLSFILVDFFWTSSI